MNPRPDLVINGVFHALDRDDPLALASARRQLHTLSNIPETLSSLSARGGSADRLQYRRSRQAEIVVRDAATRGN